MILTLPEALYIVSQNAHGVAMNYWNVYLPAILMVNEAFPITGYNTIDEDDSYFEDMDYLDWLKELNRQFDERNN